MTVTADVTADVTVPAAARSLPGHAFPGMVADRAAVADGGALPVHTPEGRLWSRDAVVYQVFLASFCDGNGDGVGDLIGLAAKMPYLAWLGVDAVWITPHYPSPQADGGYDIADHTGVHPDFGTLADYDAMLEAAHSHGIRVLIDIVPNHVSAQHPWFRDALAGVPGARDRFHFRPTGPDGTVPNNWQSLFGGPAWTLDEASGEYYLHLFSPEQPDLNWEHPDVAAEYERILRFWLDRGTDGVRIDVAAGLYKDRSLRDNPGTYSPGLFGHGPEQVHTWDQPAVHDVYRSWNALLGAYPHAPASVGEVCLADLDATAAYCRPDELGSAFTIELLKTSWGAASYAHAITGPIEAFSRVGARPAWVLGNHDKSRMVTRFAPTPDDCGDLDAAQVGERRARAAALLLAALPGSLYLYAGDELGLPDADVPATARLDPIFHRSGGTRLGRDGVRVPVPWSAGRNAGFSTTDGPLYLPQPDGWVTYAASDQSHDPDSFLSLYRRLLHLRRTLRVFGVGDGSVTVTGDVLTLEVLDGPRRAWCLLNAGDQPATCPAPGTLLATSDVAVTSDGQSVTLPGNTACWLLSD